MQKMNAPYHGGRLIEWLVRSAAAGAGVARLARGASFRPRRATRARHPRRSASLWLTRALRPRNNHRLTCQCRKVKKCPHNLPQSAQCSDPIVQLMVYKLVVYEILSEKPSRPICSNTVDLFKFPIDGLEGSTTSYMVFDVLRNSFHVCRKQTRVWKTKDTWEASEWHCLLRCSRRQVERSPESCRHIEIFVGREVSINWEKTNITYENSLNCTLLRICISITQPIQLLYTFHISFLCDLRGFHVELGQFTSIYKFASVIG